MKKFTICTLTAAAVLSATPAFAEVKSGARVEALVGFDEISVDLSDFGLDDESKSGVAYGVGAGYDFAVSPTAAFGIDVEYTQSSAKIEYEVAPEFLSATAGRDLYIGARATFAVSDTMNIYAKAGYTNGRVNVFYDDGVDTFSEGGNGDGVRGGIGAQLSFGQLYGFAEYRYSNYEGGIYRNQGMVGLGARF